MEKIGNKIRNARKETKLTQKQLGDIVGVSQKQIGRWENNLVETMKIENLEKISQALGVDKSYFLNIKTLAKSCEDLARFGDVVSLRLHNLLRPSNLQEVLSKMAQSVDLPPDFFTAPATQEELEALQDRTPQATPSPQDSNILFYPRIKVSAGCGLTHLEDEESLPIPSSLFPHIGLHEKLEMIQVSGESMLPYVSNGDYILLSRTTEPRNGDIIIFNYQGDLYIKQLFKNPSTHSITLTSSNPDYPSFTLQGDEVDSLLIIGVLRARIVLY